MAKKKKLATSKTTSKKTVTPSIKFKGFPQTLPFLEEVADNNNRDWFNENKERYEELVRSPALAFITHLQKPLAKLSECLLAESKKVGGSLMRPYRDTRFAKDKTPIKTNLGIQFRHRMGKDVHAPGFYVHIQPGDCFLGVGIWRPDSTALSKIRTSIDLHHKSWQKTVDRIVSKGDWSVAGERLKRKPASYSQDHPGIELLKLKDHMLVAKISERDIQGPDFASAVMKKFKTATPFMLQLCQAIDVPF